jgi:hypothetical protein
MDFNETWIFTIDFRKKSNVKFDQNSSNGSRVVTSGRPDMTKLRVDLRNFTNGPEKWRSESIRALSLKTLLVLARKLVGETSDCRGLFQSNILEFTLARVGNC